MKLFSWMQSKISGKQNTSTKPHVHHPSLIKRDEKEEFSDWPNGVLSIGTLFNKKDNNNNNDINNKENKNNEQVDLSFEEVNQLQKELTSLISSTDLDLLSGFEAENNNNNNNGSSSNNEEHDHEENDDDDQHYTIIPNNNNKPKDVCLDGNNNAISKKSLSFLLKKVFVCGGGFGPTFSLRDPTMLPPKTRMNKILRALLRKKIYPQSNCQTMARRNKCLERSSNNFDDYYDDDDENEHIANFYLEGSDCSKWVKTDTEYIVLEI